MEPAPYATTKTVQPGLLLSIVFRRIYRLSHSPKFLHKHLLVIRMNHIVHNSPVDRTLWTYAKHPERSIGHYTRFPNPMF